MFKNVLDKFKNRLESARTDERGTTLIDAVISVALTLALVGVTAVAFQAAMDIDNKSLAKANSEQISSGFYNQIRNASKDAVAVRVSSSNTRLDIKTKDGQCRAWRINGENLQSAKSATAIPEAAGWVTLKSDVSEGSFSIANGTVDFAYAVEDQTSTGSFPMPLTGKSALPCW